MEQYYSYKKNEEEYKIRYSLEAREVLNDFSYAFNLACHLMKDIFNANYFFVELPTNTTHRPWGLELNVNTNNGVLSLILNDLITIKSDKLQVTYSYQMWHLNMIARIVSLTAFLDDCTIFCEYSTRFLKVEINYPDKLFTLETPYSSDDMIDYNFFRTIKNSSGIFELKKIYDHVLSKMQDKYDSMLTTTIAVYQKVEDKIVLTDRICFSNGIIDSYLFSSVKDNVIISIEGNKEQDDELKIKNYDPTNNNVNLNEEANSLLIRKRNFMNPKIYRLN